MRTPVLLSACRTWLPNLGALVIPKSMVPFVTMRTSGLFRRLGNMEEPSPPVHLRPVRTKLECGLLKAPREAEEIMLVHGMGSGRRFVVMSLVKRVTLI